MVKDYMLIDYMIIKLGDYAIYRPTKMVKLALHDVNRYIDQLDKKAESADDIVKYPYGIRMKYDIVNDMSYGKQATDKDVDTVLTYGLVDYHEIVETPLRLILRHRKRDANMRWIMEHRSSMLLKNDDSAVADKYFYADDSFNVKDFLVYEKRTSYSGQYILYLVLRPGDQFDDNMVEQLVALHRGDKTYLKCDGTTIYIPCNSIHVNVISNKYPMEYKMQWMRKYFSVIEYVK